MPVPRPQSTNLVASRRTKRGRSPKRVEEQRLCAHPDCDVALSSYNRRDYCYRHWPVRFPRIRGN